MEWKETKQGKKIIHVGGHLHGHIMDEYGVLYSLAVRIVFSAETGKMGIRSATAYRCSNSLDNRPMKITLEPWLIPQDGELDDLTAGLLYHYRR